MNSLLQSNLDIGNFHFCMLMTLLSRMYIDATASAEDMYPHNLEMNIITIFYFDTKPSFPTVLRLTGLPTSHFRHIIGR